ncbi:hypothetical protein TrVGV298_007775 [Trichoderma virens]|nr:hypothetical protein TrVGV298_007775 [Trichoderma virens]
MRFEDWDILLFPRDCKVPVKEFKVACHVIHDTEFTSPHGSLGLPTVCCFIPSLASGTPFQVSIHSWSSPTVSQFTRCYSKYGDSANFEARVFIDGQLVASATLDRESDWPHVVIHSFGVSKNGELEPLRFPSFREELLRQNHWNPADNFGRIKIVISEGFPRDSLSMPIERVKNVVAFSFQHAPLEILEASCIAWPNPSMWRRVPVATSMAVQAYPSDDTDSHAHSPRRKYNRINANLPSSSTGNLQSIMANRPVRLGRRKSGYQSGSSRSTSGSTSTGTLESISDSNAYFEWLNGMGTGMTDIYRFGEQQLFPPMGQNGKKPTNVDLQPIMPMGNGMGPYLDQTFGLQNFRHEADRDHFGYLKPPAEVSDVETSCCQEPQDLFLPRFAEDNVFSIDVPNSLAHSLLNQPTPAHLLANNLHATTPNPELKPNREDCHQGPGSSPSSASSTSNSLKDHGEVGKPARRPYKARGINLQAESSRSRGYRSTRPDINQQLSSVEDYLSALEGSSMGEAAMANATAQSVEKGTKRNRDSASAPVSAVKSDDNQRRPSPRAHLTALLSHSPVLSDH